ESRPAPSSIARGMVLSQRPEPGLVPREQTVELVVSSGQPTLTKGRNELTIRSASCTSTGGIQITGTAEPTRLPATLVIDVNKEDFEVSQPVRGAGSSLICGGSSGANSCNIPVDSPLPVRWDYSAAGRRIHQNVEVKILLNGPAPKGSRSGNSLLG